MVAAKAAGAYSGQSRPILLPEVSSLKYIDGLCPTWCCVWGEGEGGQQAKVGSHAETCTNSISPGTAACRFGRWEVHYFVAREDKQTEMESRAFCWRARRVFQQSEVRAAGCKGGRGQKGDGDGMSCSVADGPEEPTGVALEMRWKRGWPPPRRPPPKAYSFLFSLCYPGTAFVPFLWPSRSLRLHFASAPRRRSAAGTAGRRSPQSPVIFFIFFRLDCVREHGLRTAGCGVAAWAWTLEWALEWPGVILRQKGLAWPAGGWSFALEPEE